MKNKVYLIICFLFFLSCSDSFVLAADFPTIPDAGVINTHDLNSFMEFDRQKVIDKEIKRIEEEDSKKQDEPQKIKKKREKKTIKAKIEDYATSGVYIKNIEVSPSEILTKSEIEEIINEYTESNVKFEELKEIVNRINTLYMNKGYVTARAYLPEQTIENGIVKIELIEGKVGDISISGNKWTRSSYIKKRISQESGKIFDMRALENDIVLFNRYNNGVQLNGTLLPGKNTLGTTDIVLNAEEKSPFHVTAIFDNGGRETIGKYRAGLMLQDESLFGFRDRLTIGAYANKHSVSPFADYNVPVNKKDGRVGFMFSSGFNEIANGPFSPFNIKSRSFIYSLYYTQPLIRKPHMELASTISANYKQATMSFDGVDLNTNKIPSAQAGLNFRYDTQRGIWYLFQNVEYAFPIFDEEANYVKIDGGFTRLHDFGHGVVAQLRGNYQVIPKDVVPSIDQFQLGGMNTVRGYSEGLIIGRSGYFLSAELMFPILPRTILSRDKTKRIPFVGNYVKGVTFVDHGAVFPYKGSGVGAEGIDSSDIMLSVGVGLKINLPGNIGARLSWGFPCIRNRYETGSSWGRFHFELSFAPDFDAIVRLRHPKPKKENL